VSLLSKTRKRIKENNEQRSMVRINRKFYKKQIKGLSKGKSLDLTMTQLAKYTESIFNGDSFSGKKNTIVDPILQHSWVAIAMDILPRFLTKSKYTIMSNNIPVTSGIIFDLFDTPNTEFNAPSFWHTMWLWYVYTNDIFIWFGPDFTAGIPTELFIINPQFMSFQEYDETWFFNDYNGNAFYIAEHEMIHIWKPNTWVSNRGVNTLVSLYYEISQDIAANQANLSALENNAIPDGLLSTDQKINKFQADQMSEEWETKHGVKSHQAKRIAVLGQGAKFQALNVDLIKYLELKPENRTTILTKFGIPLKVANATTEKTALSGKDSNEQYKAFWSQTLIPELTFVQRELHSKFFVKFNLNYTGEFYLGDIPELQEDEADLHKRLQDDVEKALLTPNEARRVLKREDHPDGDILYYKGKRLGAEDTEPDDDPENDPEEEKNAVKAEDKYINKILRS